MSLLFAGLMGVIAGLRTLSALTAVSWAAYARILDVGPGWLAFLGHAVTPWVFTALFLGELVTDKLPFTPSRKVPFQFGARITSAAIAGAAIGGAQPLFGVIAGVIGAVIGTLGGAAARAKLAQAFGRDWPAAVIEDIVAIASAATIVALMR